MTTPGLHTFKIYDRGTRDGGDELCGGDGEVIGFFTEHELPYAYEPCVFSVSIHEVTGSVGVVFKCDDYLPEEDVLAYLRGKELAGYDE